MLVLALGTWVFVEVAEEIGEGETRGVDQALLLALRAEAMPRTHWNCCGLW